MIDYHIEALIAREREKGTPLKEIRDMISRERGRTAIDAYVPSDGRGLYGTSIIKREQRGRD